MDKNLLKPLELVEKDKMLFQLLRQYSYEILRNFKVRKYKDGWSVLRWGKIYNTFYIVTSGYADIYAESKHDKKYLLCTYTRGDHIEELELFPQVGYVNRAEARDDAAMPELDRTYFVKWIRMNNSFNEYIIRTLCSSSYRVCTNMGQDTLYTPKQRICQHLVGDVGTDGKLRFAVSSEVLSQKTAMTQRSVSHVLKQLKEQGLVELNKRNTAIKDYDALNRERN